MQSLGERHTFCSFSCTLYEVFSEKHFSPVLQYRPSQDPSVKMYYIFLFSNIEQNMTKNLNGPLPTNIDLLVHANKFACVLQFKTLTTFTQSSKEQQRIYFISCTLL
jgi:hypothetical protein